MKTRNRIIFFGLIISAVVTAFVTAHRPALLFAAKAGIGEEALSGLFKEMGILKTDPTPVPASVLLEDLDGNRVRLTDFKGKIVFLNFWTTWCPPCRKEMPALEKLHNQLQHREFIILSVSLKEPAKKVEKFFKKRKLTFTALLDPKGRAAKQLGIAQIPTTFVLNKTGDIIGKALGPRHWGGQTAIRLFKELSAMD